MERFPSFVAFMRESVIPRHLGAPNDIRLDGRPPRSNGSRTAFAHFQHNGSSWKVDEDTHYHPLLIAYSAALGGTDPFVEAVTQRAKTARLSLKPELKAIQGSGDEYIYIYLDS